MAAGYRLQYQSLLSRPFLLTAMVLLAASVSLRFFRFGGVQKMVLGGISLALWRRMRDRGARAVQDFGRDFFPLILLFAISVTGLALTASTLWLRGSFYAFLSILHAITWSPRSSSSRSESFFTFSSVRPSSA